jgi:hypothetical protein
VAVLLHLANEFDAGRGKIRTGHAYVFHLEQCDRPARVFAKEREVRVTGRE